MKIKTFYELNEECGSGDLPACSCGKKKKTKNAMKKGLKKSMKKMQWSTGIMSEKQNFKDNYDLGEYYDKQAKKKKFQEKKKDQKKPKVKSKENYDSLGDYYDKQAKKNRKG